MRKRAARNDHGHMELPVDFGLGLRKAYLA